MGCKIGIVGLVLASFCVSLSLQNEEALVPTLIWNYKNPGDLKFSHNSLHNYDTASFTSHMQKMIKKSGSPLVVCFVEPLLSVEDFSAHPNAFENVKNEISHSKLLDYIPSVYNALDGIRNLEINGLHVTELADTENPITSGAAATDTDVLIIRLSEGDEERFKTLVKHDMFIAQTYKALLERRKNVIGVLTGEASLPSISSLIRYKREAEGSGNESTNSEFSSDFIMKNTFVASGKNSRAMLFAGKPLELSLPTRKITLAKDAKTETKLDERAEFQRLLITFFKADTRINLRFRFDKDASDKSWTLKTVELESLGLEITSTNLTTSSVISASIGKSFITSKEVEFANEAGTIKMTSPAGLQVQPWMLESQGERFGASEDTVQYFTAGIWMGIFVMSILALVFTLGITMIMDIKTMDKFDDAKGKTITINAQE